MNESSLVKYPTVVSHCLSWADVVSNGYDCVISLELANHLPEIFRCSIIQACHWFVQQDQFWIAGESKEKTYFPFNSSRERAVFAIFVTLQIQSFNQHFPAK